ncbi:polyketide synthase [Sphingomonas molluscorum]
MACRAPGSANYEQFWQLLMQGRVATGPWPPERRVLSKVWQQNDRPDATISDNLLASMVGGYLDGIDRFDAQLFGISPREARLIDPQHRLLLEETWRALQDAAIDPRSLVGSPTAVFMGLCSHDYSLMGHEAGAGVGPYSVIGSAQCIAANRISYVLGLEGPSIVVDAACAASLMAIHLAIAGLQRGDCDLALAGGANLVLTPTVNASFQAAQMLSRKGRCATFDVGADGYVRSEGVGVLVLKRLVDAVADGDPVHAVLEASGANQDGRTSSITVPSRAAQVRLVERCLRQAGLTPDEISFVEAHGTGTPIGDPVEAAALGELFGGREVPCWVGSLKANIGHTEAAAGVLATIKAILALRHCVLPPHVGAAVSLPIFAEAGSGVRLPAQPVDLETKGEPSWVHAGVSAFGFGGTNVHLVVRTADRDERPADPAPEPATTALTLSAHSPASLEALCAQWADYLSAADPAEFRAVAGFAEAAFTGEKHRVSIVARSGPEAAAELLAALERWRAGADRDAPAPAPSTPKASRPRPKRPLPPYPFSGKSYWADHLPTLTAQDDFALPEMIAVDFGDDYISEHRIVGNVVVPGATIMMTVLGTLRDVSRRSDLKLRDVKFRQALILEGEGQHAARLNLSRLDRQSYRFELAHPLNGAVFASGNIAVGA